MERETGGGKEPEREKDGGSTRNPVTQIDNSNRATDTYFLLYDYKASVWSKETGMEANQKILPCPSVWLKPEISMRLPSVEPNNYL